MMDVRIMTLADIGFFMSQCMSEGWAVSEAWLETHLAHDPEGCFMIDVDGAPVAMMTTNRFATTGWMGNRIVDVAWRGKGIGSHLLRHGFDYLCDLGVETIRVESEESSIRQCHRLGFDDEFDSPRLVYRGGAVRPGGVVESLERETLAEAAALDLELFGDDRSRFLELLFGMSDGAWLARRQGQLAGFVMRQAMLNCVLIGPCVAVDAEVASDLLRATMQSGGDLPFVASIPSPNVAGVQLFEALGFATGEPCLRQRFGPPIAAGRIEGIFALATGAAG